MAVAYRRLRILTPSLGAYYGVVDEEYRPHELASRWLEVRFFGRAQAETTSAQYAGSIALFLTWSRQGGRDLEQAARNLHLLSIVVWGVIGFIQGGWPEALQLGLIGGPCFALAGIVLLLLSGRRRDRSGKEHG
jgi:hypothetical protein